MAHPFQGTGVAMITPFKDDLSIDYHILETLVEDQIQSGTDYIVALGTTAETPTLTVGEQQQVVDCIKSTVNNRVPILLGMGGNSPAQLIQRISATNFEGINGILSVTPFYNKPSQQGLIEYFRQIAESCPVPVVLYNVPSRTGINMLAETSLAIANACPNVIAVKEASGESSQVAKMVKYEPDHFRVISGDDVLTLPILAVGGIGVISVMANALPVPVNRLVHLALNNQYAEAREWHLKLIDLFKLLFQEGNPSGVKALMEISGKASARLRSPLTPVSKGLYSKLEKQLKLIL